MAAQPDFVNFSWIHRTRKINRGVIVIVALAPCTREDGTVPNPAVLWYLMVIRRPTGWNPRWHRWSHGFIPFSESMAAPRCGMPEWLPAFSSGRRWSRTGLAARLWMEAARQFDHLRSFSVLFPVEAGNGSGLESHPTRFAAEFERLNPHLNSHRTGGFCSPPPQVQKRQENRIKQAGHPGSTGNQGSGYGNPSELKEESWNKLPKNRNRPCMD